MTGNSDARSGLRTLSFSEISAALTCQARHAFAYTGHLTGGDALKRRSIAPILSDGRAWGAAVAAWHAHSSGGLDARWIAHAALRASYALDRVQQEEMGVFLDVVEQREQIDRTAEILDHYMATAVRLGNLTRLEDDLVSAIPSRSGRRPSNRYRFLARIDGFHVDDGGREWIVEFKLRGQLQALEQLERSRQLRWYAWSRQRETGRPVVGVIVDERLNEAPRPARIVQRGKEDPQAYACPRCDAAAGQPCEGPRGPLKSNHTERSKLAAVLYGPSHDTSQLTTPEAYLAVCQEFGVEPDLEALAVFRARRWQHREPIPFRPSELDESGRELVSAAELIRDLDSGRRYPIRNAAAHICGGCAFRRICANPQDRLFVDTDFDRRPPKRLRGDEEAGQKKGGNAREAKEPDMVNRGPASIHSERKK